MGDSPSLEELLELLVSDPSIEESVLSETAWTGDALAITGSPGAEYKSPEVAEPVLCEYFSLGQGCDGKQSAPLSMEVT